MTQMKTMVLGQCDHKTGLHLPGRMWFMPN